MVGHWTSGRCAKRSCYGFGRAFPALRRDLSRFFGSCGCLHAAPSFSPVNSRSSGIRDEGYSSYPDTARVGELFSIVGSVVREYYLVFEIGQPSRWVAVNWLTPDVRDTAACVHVGDRTPVRRLPNALKKSGMASFSYDVLECLSSTVPERNLSLSHCPSRIL